MRFIRIENRCGAALVLDKLLWKSRLNIPSPTQWEREGPIASAMGR